MEHYQAIIVDDDYENRYSFDVALQRLEWNEDVRLLDSFDRLLNYLKSLPNSNHYPLLIVLSYDIQKMNGAQALTTLRQHEDFKHIPVVIYTNSLSPLLCDKLLSIGALECYQKGIGIQEAMVVAEKIKVLAETIAEVPRRY